MDPMLKLSARPNALNQTLIVANGLFGVRTKTLDMNFEEFMDKWNNYSIGKVTLIQDAFPNLSPSDREFLISGADENDWTNMFGKDEADEDSDVQAKEGQQD
jgi:hypothetical protein